MYFLNLFFLKTGWDIKHPIAAITAQWMLMHVFGGTKLCIFLSFVVQMVGSLFSFVYRFLCSYAEKASFVFGENPSK